MADISHFMIPADNVERAKHFYESLLGWKIEPSSSSGDPARMDAMQYHSIITGPSKAGMLSSGGLYKRHMNEPVLDFVEVEDVDAVIAKVENLCGKITMPATAIPGVGLTAMILDSEGNVIGIWKPERK